MVVAKKKIVLLGTGGTIAGTSSVAGANTGYTAGQISVDDLIAAVPALRDVAAAGLVAEQIAQIDSKDMTHGIWLRLARHCEQHLADPDVQGVVITHGTDTLEETAWFLQQLLAPRKPVVLCSAMRPATALAPDGPQNLLDAVTLAADEGAGTGVFSVAAGEIHGAREVAKVHPLRLNAFASRDQGPLGWVEDGRIRWSHGAAVPAAVSHSPVLPLLGVAEADCWPQVEIVMSHAGSNGAVVDALVEQGAVDGLIVASTGNATVHEALGAALDRAVQAGVAVRVASRCPEGAALPDADAKWPVMSGLSPVKARVSLMLELMAQRSSD